MPNQSSRLITIQIRRRPARVHPECEAGFRTDRAAGLIYGPYMITDPTTHQRRFALDAEEASMIADFCPYCGHD